jgi:uncharacterized protein YacL
MQPPTHAEAYSWSNARILENVVANVISGAILALLLGVVSTLGLLVQHFFEFIVIPTNLLTAVAFLSIGVFVTLLAIAGLAYLALSRTIKAFPLPFILAYLAFAISLSSMNDSAQAKAAADEPKETGKTQETMSQDASHGASTQQSEQRTDDKA